MLEVQDQGVGRVGFLGGLSPQCAHGRLLPASSDGHSSVCIWVVIASFCKDTGQIILGSMLLAPFHLITSSETLPSKSHIWRYWGLGINLWIWGDTSQCQSTTSPNKNKNKGSSLVENHRFVFL